MEGLEFLAMFLRFLFSLIIIAAILMFIAKILGANNEVEYDREDNQVDRK